MIPHSCLIIVPPSLPPARDFVESLVVSLTFEWQNRIAGFFPKTPVIGKAVRRRRGYLLQEKFGLYFTDTRILAHFQLAIFAKSYQPDSGQIPLMSFFDDVIRGRKGHTSI